MKAQLRNGSAALSALFPKLSFAQGAGSWANGTSVFELLFGLLITAIALSIGLQCTARVVKSYSRALVAVPLAAGIAVVVFMNQSSSDPAMLAFWFLVGYVPVVAVVSVIAYFREPW